MTLTWYALPDNAPFAVAGIGRPTVEWGAAYSMVMVDGCERMAEVHDRMPPDQGSLVHSPQVSCFRDSCSRPWA